MSCSPSDYLGCARSLLGDDAPEALNRTIASRAYYAAYHAAKAFHESLPSPGSVTTARGSHNQLVSQLRYPTVSGEAKTKSVAIGNILMSACANRVNADYQLTTNFLLREALENISAAEQILLMINPNESVEGAPNDAAAAG